MYSCNLTNYNNNLSFGKREKLPIYVMEKVSNSFMNEVHTGVKEYPIALFSKIQKTGLDQIRLASKASNSVPDIPELQNIFKNELVPGSRNTHDEIANGEAVIGTSKDGKKYNFLGLFESPLCLSIKANKGSVGHELTHKADSLLKSIIGIDISSIKGFKAVVSMDLCKLSERKNLYPQIYNPKMIDYIMQKSTPENLNEAGLREIFAECGASLTTGSQNENHIKVKSEFMKTFFPKSYEYVQKYLYLMGMR